MRKLLVGTGTCGLSAGPEKSSKPFETTPGSMSFREPGCIGMCFVEPLLEVRDGESRRIYGEVTPRDGPFHRVGRRPRRSPAWSSDGLGSHADFWRSRTDWFFATAASSIPSSIDDYIATRRLRGPREGADGNDPRGDHPRSSRTRASAAAAAPGSPPA
ncbi:MAG: (2Fe-2S) ferredoxin domain-containing protein [Desulfobacterales bacterium]|nr:(2Fe-2S) ferredoxin domain-containing protein [Desulfobacterales bacterium]